MIKQARPVPEQKKGNSSILRPGKKELESAILDSPSPVYTKH